MPFSTPSVSKLTQQEQFAADSKALFKDTTWTSASATATYSLPTDFMYEKWVYFNGLPLNPLNRAKLSKEDQNDDWPDDAGTPTNYLVDPQEVCPLCKAIFRALQCGKAPEEMVFVQGYYLVALDGTGYFPSQLLHCASC